MYFNPCRRGGMGGAGARARQVPVDVHEGTRTDFLRRHEMEAAQAVQAGSATREGFCSRLLRRTADTRNLRLAWDWLATGDGQSPGIDDMRFADLEEHEIWEMVRTIRQAILNDTYRPAPDRHIRIPKSSGNGTRPLAIPTIVDRVVQRAIVQILQPYLDPGFDENSLGYRPGISQLHALARAERLARETGHWTGISEDIKDAFTQVPQRRLLDILRHHIPSDDMMRLIERVVLTKAGKGLRQGGNLSPLLLNVYLDRLLDRQWRTSHPGIPLLRVADDLLLLCNSKEEAEEAYTCLKQLLQVAAMPLKGSPATAIHDLAKGESIDWLGFKLTKTGQDLELRLTEKAWRHLREKVVLAHNKPDSPLRAPETVNGWVTAMGPCYPHTDLRQAYARITSLCQEQAFDEIPTFEEIQTQWELAHKHWCLRRNAIATGHLGRDASGSARWDQNLAGNGQRGEATTAVASPFLSPCRQSILLYTDGACITPGGIGGWACVIENADSGVWHSRSGSSRATTNNRMELEAAIQGLLSLTEPCYVHLVSDSIYLVRGIREWLPRWKLQGWRTGSGRRKKALKNLDLWRRLDELLQMHEVTCGWVRGHDGHSRNEECDRLARQAADELVIQLRGQHRLADPSPPGCSL